jgi:hypothetical protein
MARSGDTLQKLSAASNHASFRRTAAQSRKSDRLQDAVYREMFLLESKRPGAEMGLALALLRAMAASEKIANREEFLYWLSKICPHCLKMIESALDEYCACAPGTPEDAVPVTSIKP